MARGYRFDAKSVCPIGNYAGGTPVFCSRNKAPSHFLNRTIEYLRHNFPWDRLITRQTKNPWPSYSQDFNPSDYFLKEYLKDRVCENTHRQERTSSERKSDEFHKKCLIEFGQCLSCCCAVIQQRGAWNEHSINY